jgi:prepilin-type N-terminal cleavage/methylation domain-containing protein
MRTSLARGFTLIELLVVIAIIGILSSVVLASLVLARIKAVDAAVKTNLRSMISQMELVYDANNPNSYGTAQAPQSSPSAIVGGSSVFFTDLNVRGQLVGALQQGGPGCWSVGVGGKTYAVAIPLKAESDYYWCIDSTGVSKKVAATLFSGTCSPIGASGTAASCP